MSSSPDDVEIGVADAPAASPGEKKSGDIKRFKSMKAAADAVVMQNEVKRKLSDKKKASALKRMGTQVGSLYSKVEGIRVLVAMSFYACLVVIGMAVFSALERPTELAERAAAEAAYDSYSKVQLRLDALKETGALSKEDYAVLGQYAPAKVTELDYENWDTPGAFFFAATVVTTIGYGNTAPVTPGGKVFMIFYCIVGIAAAGPVFATAGDFLIKLMWKLPICPGQYKKPTKVTDAASVKVIFEEFDTDKSGTLDRTELDQALGAIRDKLGGADLSKEEIDELVKEVDDDNSGTLDEDEFAHAIERLSIKKNADDRNANANQSLVGAGISSLFILLLGTFCFMAFMPAWDFLSSIYFCVVTLTTVGLGDLYPDIYVSVDGKAAVTGAIIFWYFYTQMGLAIIAILITACSDKVSATIAKMRAEMAKAAMLDQEESGTEDGEKARRPNTVVENMARTEDQRQQRPLAADSKSAATPSDFDPTNIGHTNI